MNLDDLGLKLEGQKDEAVSMRSHVERRLLNNLRQYHCEHASTLPVKEQPQTEPHKLTRDNLTRPAVIITSARIADMLFPTNDDNWDIEPSPVPELANPKQVVGQVDTSQGVMPVTAGDMMQATRELAEAKARRMKKHISDQLQECQYAAEGRQAIFDACQLGTGILKGPFVKSVKRKSWDMNGPVPTPKVEEVLKPAAKRVDPWNFYPQPSRSIKEAEYTFELNLYTKSQVRKLANQPGFDRDQVNKLAGTEPSLGTLATAPFVQRSDINGTNYGAIKDRYPVWEYHGPIEKECLAYFGIEVPDDDNITTVVGEVWFSQGIVLKATLSHMEGCDELPYHVFNYEEDPNDIFGYAVGDFSRDDQTAADQIWHAIILNSMMSSGPQLGVMKGAVVPEDGRYDFSCFGPKVWAFNDVENADVSKIFQAFNVPNITQYLLPVYERIKQNAQEHTMLPLIAQGEPTSAVPTSSGLAMLMNASNVVQRRSAKQWDDDITIPLVGAFYHWNMLYGTDVEAKGDYDIIPKGASHLLVKDMQAQRVQILTQLSAADPRIGIWIKGDWLARKNVEVLDFSSEGALKTKEEVDAEQQQQQAPDPRIVAAEINERVKMAEIQSAQQIAGLEAQTRVMVADRNVEAAYLSVASSEAVKLAEVNAKVNIEANKAETEKFMAGVDVQFRAAEMAQKERKMATEIQVESPDPRLA